MARSLSRHNRLPREWTFRLGDYIKENFKASGLSIVDFAEQATNHFNKNFPLDKQYEISPSRISEDCKILGIEANFTRPGSIRTEDLAQIKSQLNIIASHLDDFMLETIEIIRVRGNNVTNLKLLESRFKKLYHGITEPGSGT